MDCRSCSEHLLPGAQFCHTCGDTAALLELDETSKLRYCGKCFSRLQGNLKYCIHCGDASPHAGLAKKGENQLWAMLQNPRIQFVLFGSLAALLILPTISIVFREPPPPAPQGGIAEENKVRNKELGLFSVEEAIFGEEDEERMTTAAGIAVDSQGNHYVSDWWGNQVFKITPGGRKTVYAGTGEAGYSGDGGPAVDARLNRPRGLAVDSWDNLLIADSGNGVIRVVDPRSRVIRSLAGAGPSGIKTSGGPPVLEEPMAIYFGPDGKMYVADSPCSNDPETPTLWVLEPLPEEPSQSLAPRRETPEQMLAALYAGG